MCTHRFTSVIRVNEANFGLTCVRAVENNTKQFTNLQTMFNFSKAVIGCHEGQKVKKVRWYFPSPIKTVTHTSSAIC
mgnify:FL=1